MKALFAAVLAFGTTGCLGIEQASIQTAADEQNTELDTQCKLEASARTDAAYIEWRHDLISWCNTQYQLVEARRESDMSEAGSNARFRAAIFANALRRR